MTVIAIRARSLARRHASLIVGALQAVFTTGFATAIACARTSPPGQFFLDWAWAWLVAYVMILPIVILITRPLRRVAEWLAGPDG